MTHAQAPWLPEGWQHPTRVDLPTGHHLRPIHTDDTELIGCVYNDEYVGTGVETALDALVPEWIARDWPLAAPRYVGRDLSWAEWLSIPRE